jgi:hypothetical protein
MLTDVLAGQPPVMTLDLSDLEFLNSSGINLLAKYTIRVRQQANVQVVVRGSSENPW